MICYVTDGRTPKKKGPPPPDPPPPKIYVVGVNTQLRKKRGAEVGRVCYDDSRPFVKKRQNLLILRNTVGYEGDGPCTNQLYLRKALIVSYAPVLKSLDLKKRQNSPILRNTVGYEAAVIVFFCLVKDL